MRKTLITLASLALMTATLGVHPHVASDDQEKEKQASVWMKQKLGASQNILGGLTKADFNAVRVECRIHVVCRLSGKMGPGGHTGIPKIMYERF